MLLAVNSNFLVFSVSSDDMMGQSFASLVPTVAAAESAIGSAKRERAQRRKHQTLWPNGNQQRRNDKMRCPGHPHLEGRVEGFGPVAFPVPPSSGGACVGGAQPEFGLEALTLPTSRQLVAVGHDYYKKAPMKMNISHGGVCICMLGVLLSCDPAAYVRPVAHASYLFRAA
ncbi:hypothetical protein AgCh_038079 [Apium graveolens]